MTALPWRERWFEHVAPRRTSAWRGVEAQHIVATMKLVDTLEEQALLEDLLEASKPPLPTTARALHYLLTTPFRYRSPVASRFRAANDAGAWYGAETLRTAAAEVAYWRWRFIADSPGLLAHELLTEHSFFQADVQGAAIDLSEEPWKRARKRWMADREHSATQALAQAAREHGVQWIRSESVRDAGGRNVTVFAPGALALCEGVPEQTWHCKTTRNSVMMVHGSDRHAWHFGATPAKTRLST